MHLIYKCIMCVETPVQLSRAFECSLVKKKKKKKSHVQKAFQWIKYGKVPSRSPQIYHNFLCTVASLHTACLCSPLPLNWTESTTVQKKRRKNLVRVWKTSCLSLKYLLWQAETWLEMQHFWALHLLIWKSSHKHKHVTLKWKNANAGAGR